MISRALTLALGLAVTSVACAGGPEPARRSPVGPSVRAQDADAAWLEMNRALQGRWQAITTEGRTVRTSYRTLSKGSALAESFTTASGTETLTVVHRDGDGLVLTHYCAQGNQARLRATAAGPQKVVFELADATNVRPGQGVMQKLVFVLRPDGFDQESVYLDDGKLEATTLHFVRDASGP